MGILTWIKSWISLLPGFSWTNFLEVLIISILVYQFLKWIYTSRAFTLLLGIVVILGFTLFCFVFHLNTILWILERISTIAVIALIVIFQPELRKALEMLGVLFGTLPMNSIRTSDNMMSKESASMLSKAVFQMAKVKTGALIVIEQTEKLDDFIKTGIAINGDISTGLIVNIFEKNTPLHDGAVIIRGDKVAAATCYLPLSESTRISKDLGTRHRAAYGISEVTDSITLVVSEETGNVSYVYKGKLIRIRDEQHLDKMLVRLINKSEVRFFQLLNLRKNTEDLGEEEPEAPAAGQETAENASPAEQADSGAQADQEEQEHLHKEQGGAETSGSAEAQA